MSSTTQQANNNSQTLPPDANVKHRTESAMLSTTTINVHGFARPEMPIYGERRFPLQQQQSRLQRCFRQTQQQQLQQQVQKPAIVLCGKFPLLMKNCTTCGKSRFPLQHAESERNKHLSNYTTTTRFPLRMTNSTIKPRFPELNQMPQIYLNPKMQAISSCGCCLEFAKSNINLTARASKEFPTIKKQFVSFCNQQQLCKISADANGNVNAGHGKCQNKAVKARTDVVPTPARPATTTTTTTTVTQMMSQFMSTKIDTHSQRTVDVHHNDVHYDVIVSADVHKLAFDNELNAHEQTFNLNVEAEGVGERKEIEHQQAENFNDAFGRRHDNNNDDDDDAMMIAAVLAKNKREICEQVKLEATAAPAHNVLNMTKEQQSICLASERNQTIADEPNASNCQQRHSDARESSSEQVDGQQQQPVSVWQHQVNSNTATTTAVTQNESGQTSLSLSCQSSSSLSSAYPSIEFLKCAVRGVLDEGATSCVSLVDFEYIDLLNELVQLIARPTNTGIYWSSEPADEQVASECADMTVSKVSDESETTAAVIDIYSEQIEQPVELDDNNNNNSSSSIDNQSVDMKYETIRSTTPRLSDTQSLRRLSGSTTAATTTPATTTTTAAVATAKAAASSRLRDVTTPTTRPLLGELKRASSSREDVSIDVDSVLPERTRLRRQRRMRSQDSTDEKPEDLIERLNKLKARISGALSEVKGVLKQYSTESEAEGADDKATIASTSTAAALKPEKDSLEPVQFRFVRKVRRRSCFDEAEEETEQPKEADNLKDKEASVNEGTTKIKKEQLEEKTATEVDNKIVEELRKPTETIAQKVNEETKKTEKEQLKEQPKAQPNKEQNKKEIDEAETAKVLLKEQTTKKQKKAEKSEEEKTIKEQTKEQLKEQPEQSDLNEEIKLKVTEKTKAETKIEFLAKVESELKSKAKKKEPSVDKEQPKQANSATTATMKPQQPNECAEATTTTNKQQQPTEGAEATPQTATLPNESATQPASSDVSKTDLSKTEIPAPVVTKKKTVSKLRNPRRASVAAVEPSKILVEPMQLDALAQRRPSDSETIIKRKKKQKLTSIDAAIASGSNLKTTKAPQQQQAMTINEQLVAAKVNDKAITANSVAKSIAKSAEGEANELAATVTATTTTAAVAAATVTKPTATTATKAKTSAAAAATSVPAATTTAAAVKLGATATPTAATVAAEKAATATTATQTAQATVKSTTTAVTAATPAATTTPAASTTATTIATATPAATTAPAATAQTAPKQLPIDDIGNRAIATDQSRRASLKLAELVGETVLLVPAATTAATTSTQDIKPTAAASITTTTSAGAASTTLSTAINSSLSQSKEPINQSAIIPLTAQAEAAAKEAKTFVAETTPQQVVVDADIEVAPVDVGVASAPQIAATLSAVPHDESSPEQQQLVEATKDNAQAQTDDSLAAMPELKVLSGPVQPVKIETVEQPHDEADLVVSKKKTTHLKKLVRKTSIDKGKEKVNEPVKLNNILKDKNKINDLADRLNKLAPPKKPTVKVNSLASKVNSAAAKEISAVKTETQQENAEITEIPAAAIDITEPEPVAEPETEPEPQPEPEPAPKPKKPRQVKKKVIIKRQKRRLSIGDTFFIQQEPEEPKVPEIETIEKAIAYVTDDEDDVETEPEPEPVKPLKSCLHVREYKIGDLVLYAERYRKTQVRWKRGRVLERITSISYKLDIEGKEVAAHISYIKKYTGRKVKFVGKEYLEIDYEQVVEEERRARSYSIWNMV